jgi:dTDP-4-amino-4,6-dideoxygalactose transaminase
MFIQFSMPLITPLFPDTRNVVLTNYGRAAFEKVLQIEELSGGTIILPALLCREGFESLVREYDLDLTFVDIDPETYHPDFESAAAASPDADACLLPHTFGVPADGPRWRALSEAFDLTLIEDCARSLGATLNGQPLGGYGEFAIYSLRKVTPAMSGGALATTIDPSDIDLGPAIYDLKNAYPLVPDLLEGAAKLAYERLLKSRTSAGGTESSGTSDHPSSVRPRGIDGITALVLLAHLRGGIRERIARNAAAARRVRSVLEPLGVEFQTVRGTSPFHFLGMTVPDNRDEIVERMRDVGIVARRFWQPPLVSVLDEGRLSDYPNAQTLVETGLQLPLVEMDDAAVETAIDIIRETLQKTSSNSEKLPSSRNHTDSQNPTNRLH